MITVTDLFCGAGGSSSGLTTLPGVRVVMAAMSVVGEKMETASKERWNAPRGLTHSLDETKEGLAWSLPKPADFDALTVRHAASNSPSRTRFASRTFTAGGARTARNAVRSLDGQCTTPRRRRSGSWSHVTCATSAASRREPSVTASSSYSRSTTTTAPARGAGSSASAAIRRSACSPTTCTYSKARSTTSTTRQGCCCSKSSGAPAARDLGAAVIESLGYEIEVAA